MSLLKLLISSIKMFYRDWRALFFSLFLPILFMTIFGLADFGKFSNIKIGVIDQGQTDESKELVKKLDEIDILDVKADAEDTLKEQLKKGDIDLVLVLPKDLVKMHMVDVDIPGLDQLPSYIQIPKMQKPEFDNVDLTVYTNDARKQQGQNALAILKQVFIKLNFKVTGTTEIYNFVEESVSSKSGGGYLDFIIPGIVALSIMQMSLMSIIFTIVGYREKGVLKRLQITPIKTYEFTLAQVLTRLIISCAQVAILIIIAVAFFKISIAGSYWLIALLTVLGASVFISMGLSISAIAKTQDTAAPLANVVMMPMMFLGNVFFPVETMPVWLQKIVDYLPLNYLASAMREVMVNGVAFEAIKTDIYGLVIWLAAMLLLAAFTFKWKTID